MREYLSAIILWVVSISTVGLAFGMFSTNPESGCNRLYLAFVSFGGPLVISGCTQSFAIPYLDWVATCKGQALWG